MARSDRSWRQELEAAVHVSRRELIANALWLRNGHKGHARAPITADPGAPRFGIAYSSLGFG